MENTLTDMLRIFVQEITAECQDQDGPLTIGDLILRVRGERLTEFSRWSNHDLDRIELHAASFDWGDPLDNALNAPNSSSDAAKVVPSVALLSSPSPFAWT